MKALHARIEIDQADSNASNADDRQAGLVAFALDETALPDVHVERVGENVDGVEADLLRHADAVGGFAARLSPRRIDEAEFHGESPASSSYCTQTAICFMICREGRGVRHSGPFRMLVKA